VLILFIKRIIQNFIKLEFWKFLIKNPTYLHGFPRCRPYNRSIAAGRGFSSPGWPPDPRDAVDTPSSRSHKPEQGAPLQTQSPPG